MSSSDAMFEALSVYFRNMPFAQNQGFGMMQGMPQYVQPGAGMMHPQTMMMGQTPMMGSGQANNMVPQSQIVGGQGMYPLSMMPPGGVRMMRPTAPPSYDQARIDSYQRRNQNSQPFHNNREMGKTEEQLQKERFFQQQQAKLKQFGKSGSSNLDPNKLIDSMFGGSEAPKPRSNKKQQAQLPDNNDDDGFGDFLSGPNTAGNQLVTQNASVAEIQGTSPQMKQAVPTTVNVSVSKVVPTKPTTEKKDLTKMMFESCDLKAPQKAKLFQKPSLKDITVPYHETHLVSTNVSMNARKWENTEELSDLFIQEAEKDVKSMPPKVPQTKKVTSPNSKHPPKPPPWLNDDSVLPPLYGQVLEASLVDGKIATDRLYPILLLSGLPKEKLGFIWGLCNKQTPGQLVVKELVQILAIIALIQNNFQVDSTDILFRCPHPPVPFLGQPAGPQSPVGDVQPRPVAPPQVQVGNQPASVNQSQSSQSYVPQTGQPIVSNSPVGNKEFTSPAMFGTSTVHGTQHLAPSSSVGVNPTVTSSPATLPVTQLPPAVLPQGMMGNVVNSGTGEDDFADFQAAAPAPVQPPKSGSFKALMADVKGSKRPPVKDESDYLYSVPVPDDKAIAESMSPEDFKSSTVSNFFASDDSSEATSPDDDYFDGYKSAESKPSDSTSQFSTDQSENEDFKNFESYLDEFQKKKEMRDKESPLHRPVPKHSQVQKPQSPVKTKLSMSETVKAKLPVIETVKTDARVKNSSDEFSDFADFQSAPVTVSLETPSNPLKATGSASDLIGDEDKYAALRSLDLSELSASTQPNLLGEPETEVNPVKETDDDNWADFETAAVTEPVTEVSSQVDSIVTNTDNKNKDSILKLFNEKKNDDDEWGNFDQSVPLPADSATSDWAAFSGDTTATNKQTGSLEQPYLGIDTGKPEPVNDDWADFQSTNNEDNFDSFQSAIPDSNKELVTVKNDKLGSDEILGLFKVKDIPPQTIKSLDDDVFSSTQSSVSVSQTMNRMHGISPSHEAPNIEIKSSDRKKHVSEEYDFMKPPPLNSANDDDFENEDEFGTYAGGYDLGDIMEPKPSEKKNMYGVYGLNQNFIVTGHRKDFKLTGLGDVDETVSKNVTIEVTKESDMDDSDSVSSKDNDTFRGKFGLGKDLGEDSQSVSSLDFIVNKHINNVKDGDNQSVSSSDYGNFDNSAGISGSGIAVESKSVDSLELRQDEGQTGDTSGSQDNSDKDSKEQSPDRGLSDNKMENRIFDSVPTTQGLPIVGDRYSFILSDVPGSDKHAYEWQRILDNACRMIQDANNIFNSISSSTVCNEVIKSTQGSQYIQGVVEIYRVVCKIFTSMKETGIHSDKLSKLTKDIDLAWNNLTAFLVGESVMPDSKSFDYSHGILHPEDASAEYRSCGICLLNVEMKQKGLNSDINPNLTYGGKQYHASCANFWINCVDSTLPALKLPELL